jgi:hypothetical protein
MKEHELKQKLNDALSEKVRIGGTGVAIEALRKLFEDSIAVGAKQTLWTSVIAYRAAHACMREARTEKRIEEVLKMLDVACMTSLEELRIKAALLKVIALTRLELLTGVSADDERKEMIKRSLAILKRNPSSTSTQNNRQETRSLQSDMFNMLEFCAYLTNHPYDDLEGLGLSRDVLGNVSGNHFRILTSYLPKDDYIYPLELAEAELHRLREVEDDERLVVLDRANYPYTITAGSRSRKISKDDYCLWSIIIEMNGAFKFKNIQDEFVRRTGYKSVDREALVKRLSRARKLLEALTGLDPIKSAQGSEYYQLNTELKMLALVPAKMS